MIATWGNKEHLTCVFPLWFSHDGPTSLKTRPQTVKNPLTPIGSCRDLHIRAFLNMIAIWGNKEHLTCVFPLWFSHDGPKSKKNVKNPLTPIGSGRDLFFEGVCFENYRHPDPRRMWMGGAEQQSVDRIRWIRGWVHFFAF